MRFNKSAASCQICTCLNKFRQAIHQKTDGATAIEYALIAAGIAVAISVIVYTVGGDLSGIFQRLVDGFSGP